MSEKALIAELEELAKAWDDASEWYSINFPAQLRAKLAKHRDHA